MNEMIPRSSGIIVSQIDAQPQSARFHWLNYFDPYQAYENFVDYIETQPSSRNPERHTMRVYLSSLADFCRHLGAHVTHVPGTEDYIYDFSTMEFPSQQAVIEYMAHSSINGRGASTVNRYMCAVRHWLRALEMQPMLNVHNQEDMYYWMEACRQLRMAVAADGLKKDITTHRPALENHGTRLTQGDVNKVFDYFKSSIDTLAGKRDLAIMYTLITTGLRAAEIARLTLDNIRPGDGCYEVRVRGKRNNFDPVGMDTEAYELIQQWVKAFNAVLPEGDARRITGSTPIFQPLLRSEMPVGLGDYEPAAGISPRGILKIVQRRTLAALEFSIGAHDCRRTCAYLMRNNGFELEQIRDMLRHASLVTTEKYIGKEQNLKAMLPSSRIKFFVPHSKRGAA